MSSPRKLAFSALASRSYVLCVIVIVFLLVSTIAKQYRWVSDGNPFDPDRCFYSSQKPRTFHRGKYRDLEKSIRRSRAFIVARNYTFHCGKYRDSEKSIRRFRESRTEI